MQRRKTEYRFYHTVMLRFTRNINKRKPFGPMEYSCFGDLYIVNNY